MIVILLKRSKRNAEWIAVQYMVFHKKDPFLFIVSALSNMGTLSVIGVE